MVSVRAPTKNFTFCGSCGRIYLATSLCLINSIRPTSAPTLNIAHHYSPELECLQRKAMRIILGKRFRDAISAVDYVELKLDKLSFRRNFALSCYSYKLFHSLCPRALIPFRPVCCRSPYATRHTKYRLNPTVTPDGWVTELYRRSSLNLAADILNYFPSAEALQSPSIARFKDNLVGQRLNIMFCLFPNI